MKNQPIIFVSFSGRDSKDAGFSEQLRVRLSHQKAEVWYFEQPGQAIPPTTNIEEYCKKKIDPADLFIALVPAQGFFGVVEEEVKHAFASKNEGQFLTLHSKSLDSKIWNLSSQELFKKLKKYKCLSVDYQDPGNLEQVVYDIARLLEIKYVPPVDWDRFPIYERTWEEWKAFDIKDRAGEFKSVMDMAFRCSQNYSHDKRSDCENDLKGLIGFLDYLERSIGNIKFYYPRIAEGVLHLEKSELLRRNGDGSGEDAELDIARKIFKTIIDDDVIQKNDWVYSGMGLVQLKCENFEEAYKWFEKAWNEFQKDGSNRSLLGSPEILHNLLLTAIILDRKDDLARLTDSFEEAVTSKQWEDLKKDPEKDETEYMQRIKKLNFAKVLAMQAMAYVAGGKDWFGQEVSKVIDDVEIQNDISETVLHLTDILESQAEKKEDANLMEASLEILENLSKRFPKITSTRDLGYRIAHRLFRYYYTYCQFEKALPHAINISTHLLSNGQALGFDNTRISQHLIESAQTYWILEQKKQAQKLAEQVLENFRNGTDLYYTGFSYWFLGEKDKARQDFDQSGKKEQGFLYYDQLMSF